MLAAILAGGENTRFPAPKAFIEIGGIKIIEKALSVLKGIFGEVVISTNEPERYFYLGVPLIGDVYNVRGPMTGIFSVFSATGAPEVFTVACDMPFINPELIKALTKKKKTGFDAVIPVWKGSPEPLFAFYSANCAPKMERRILQCRTRQCRTGLQDFLSEIDVLYMDEDEVGAIDPGGRSFMNINTPEDLKRAAK